MQRAGAEQCEKGRQHAAEGNCAERHQGHREYPIQADQHPVGERARGGCDSERGIGSEIPGEGSEQVPSDHADTKGNDAKACGDDDEQTASADWLGRPEAQDQRRGVERSVEDERNGEIIGERQPGHDGQQNAETGKQ